MGGVGGALGFKSTNTYTDTNKLADPNSLDLNQQRLEQLSQIFQPSNYGGYGTPLPALANYANLDSSTNNVLAQALGTNPQGLDYNAWNTSALANLNPDAQRGISSDLTGSNINALQSLVGQYGSTLDTGPLRDQFAQYSSQLGQDLRGYASQLGQDAAQTSQNAYQSIGGTGQQNLNYITGPLANQLLGSGQDYFRQILSPQIQNQHALMGLARSGANEEAQAKGAASISLPISQLIAQLAGGAQQQTQGLQAQNLGAYGVAQQNIGLNDIANQQAVGLTGMGTQQNLGLAGLGVQANLANLGIGGAQQNLLTNLQGQQGYGTQELQNLFSLGQQQPNVNIGLQNAYLSRLGQQLQFADYPRQTGAGVYNSLTNAYLTALNNAPYTPGGSINTHGSGTEVTGDVEFKPKA